MFHPDTRFGLLLERSDDRAGYGISRTIRVRAALMRRDQGHDHPLNPPSYSYDLPKHLQGMTLDDLAARGFVSDLDGNPFIGFEPGYYGRYCTELHDAERMVKTLKHIHRRFEKDAAYTAVDQFVSLCATLRLEFVVERADDYASSSYCDNNWRWMSIAEGRNRYRQMIDTARAEMMEGKTEAAA